MNFLRDLYIYFNRDTINLQASNLHNKLVEGKLEYVKDQIDQNRAVVFGASDNANHPLVLSACRYGDTELLEKFVEEGVDMEDLPSFYKYQNKGAIYFASEALQDNQERAIDVLKFLIKDQGFKLSNMNSIKNIILYGNKDLVEFFMQNALTPEFIQYMGEGKVNISSRNLLIKAIKDKTVDSSEVIKSLKFLTDEGFIEFSPKSKNFLLFKAFQHNDKAVIDFMLEQGADINGIDFNGQTILQHMFVPVLISDTLFGLAMRDNFKYLLEQENIDVNKECIFSADNHSTTKQTILHIASFISIGIPDGELKYNFNKAVKILLDNGADVNAQDSCGKTPLHYLLATFIFITKDDPEALKDYPFSINTKLVEMFIEYGADVNITDNSGKTAFEYDLKSVHLNAEKDDIIKKYAHLIDNYNSLDSNINSAEEDSNYRLDTQGYANEALLSEESYGSTEVEVNDSIDSNSSGSSEDSGIDYLVSDVSDDSGEDSGIDYPDTNSSDSLNLLSTVESTELYDL